tara:strand:- start:303 stop:503 length:201 start_codon:yes stop_codon:yes gene_type:complete
MAEATARNAVRHVCSGAPAAKIEKWVDCVTAGRGFRSRKHESMPKQPYVLYMFSMLNYADRNESAA